MKRGFVLLLILFVLPSVYSKEVSIQELFEISGEESLTLPTGSESYFYANDKLIVSVDNILEYHYQDRLGSDINSKTLPFGEEISSENRFSFTGKELDYELYYFGARYYNPNLGRFVSTDPVKENHPYTYVNNNPLNLVDPTGKDDSRVHQEYTIDTTYIENIYPDNYEFYQDYEKVTQRGITDEDRQVYLSLFNEQLAKEIRSAEKNLIGKFSQEQLDALGYGDQLPLINFILYVDSGPTVKASRKQQDGRTVFTFAISVENMFINLDSFKPSRLGTKPMKLDKSDDVFKLVARTAIDFSYGIKPSSDSYNFWDKITGHAEAIGYRGNPDNAEKWYKAFLRNYKKIWE